MAKDNKILLVDGARVKALREKLGNHKSDSNDLRAIMELARIDPASFREITIREKEEHRDEMAYSYYYKITTLIASLKNKQKTFLRT